MRFILLLALLCAASVGCEKRAAPTTALAQPKARALVASRPKIEACSLVTKEEIGAIQSATILDTQASENSDNGNLTSLCYYSSQEANMSVSLAVTQSDPAHPGIFDPREFWQQTFGHIGSSESERKESNKPEAEKETGRGAEPEKGEHDAGRSLEVRDLGESAYWVGSGVSGALYVLKDGVFLRVSVGGPGNEEVKINKSKAVALKALSRL